MQSLSLKLMFFTVTLTALFTSGSALPAISSANAKPAAFLNALNVQAEASQGFAAQGNIVPANLLVVVTDEDGAPITDLVQAEFSIINHFQLPGQTCGFSNNIANFVNVGTGAYRIRVGLPGVPLCNWVRGDYLAQVRIESGARKGQTAVTLSIR